MIHASIRVEFTATNLREALDILRPVVERTRIQSGCLSCRLYRDVQQDAALQLEEEWDSADALRAHLASADYQRVLIVLEMARGNPDIRFSTVTDMRGMDLIAETRSVDHGVV